MQQQQAREEARQAFCEMLEEHETELKFAAGGVVIAGTGTIAFVTHGAVSQPLIGSIIGGIVGGFMHYALAEEDEDAIDEAADGFMWGTINGAACASVGQFLGILGKSLTALQNPLVLSSMEGLLETAVEEFMLILQGENLTPEGVGFDLLLNIFTSGENPRMKDLADSLEPVMKKLGDWFDDTAAKALIEKVFRNADSGSSLSKQYAEKVSSKFNVNGKYSDSTSASSILRNELYEAGIESPPYKNAAHHIVPWNDSRAAQARDILDDFEIDYNSAANGVLLPMEDNGYIGDATLHIGNHSATYIELVTNRLQEVVDAGGDRNDVVSALNAIRKGLLEGTIKLN